MEWIKIDKKHLPDVEVLAACFKKTSSCYKEKVIGYLSYEDDELVCESSTEYLEDCTHYIDIHKFDIV